jgi:hypothetical protein
VSTELPQPRPRPRARPRPRRGRLVAAAVVLAVVFALGLALGAALNDNPSTGGKETFVRTIPGVEPLNVPTVTVTAP